MALTLDSGAISAFCDALSEASHPLRAHVRGWTTSGVVLLCPPVVWAEFWRGRGKNAHYLAKVRERIRVIEVTREDAELAVYVLHEVFKEGDPEPVRHLVDALLMAQAHRLKNAVYTSDVEDLSRLFPHFSGISAVIDCAGNIKLERRAG